MQWVAGAQINGAGTLTKVATRIRNHPRRPQDMTKRKSIAFVVEMAEGEIRRQHWVFFQVE